MTPMAEAVFPKCDYGRGQKCTLKDFDPRPPEYRYTANNHLPTLLENVIQAICYEYSFHGYSPFQKTGIIYSIIKKLV